MILIWVAAAFAVGSVSEAWAQDPDSREYPVSGSETVSRRWRICQKDGATLETFEPERCGAYRPSSNGNASVGVFQVLQAPVSQGETEVRAKANTRFRIGESDYLGIVIQGSTTPSDPQSQPVQFEKVGVELGRNTNQNERDYFLNTVTVEVTADPKKGEKTRAAVGVARQMGTDTFNSTFVSTFPIDKGVVQRFLLGIEAAARDYENPNELEGKSVLALMARMDLAFGMCLSLDQRRRNVICGGITGEIRLGTESRASGSVSVLVARQMSSTREGKQYAYIEPTLNIGNVDAEHTSVARAGVSAGMAF